MISVKGIALGIFITAGCSAAAQIKLSNTGLIKIDYNAVAAKKKALQ
jgi:hypothetical protein